MACFRPLDAYRLASGEVVFSERGDVVGLLKVPCGRCVGCRVARSRAWSLRCVHEASLFRENCFVTLTYDAEHLPPGGSLRYRDFQLFMKRLRRHFNGREIRFFVCGEYGEGLKRPHYHACLFNVDFPDKRRTSLLGKRSGWRSELLTRLWGHGHTHLGDLNVRSAGYAARYVLKKVCGRDAEAHYCSVDSDGVVTALQPEFARMSLRPGIGARWFDRFSGDLSRDFVVHDGARYSLPRYYDKLIGRRDAVELEQRQEDRMTRALPFQHEQTPERLRVREIVETARLDTLKRNFDGSPSGGFGA